MKSWIKRLKNMDENVILIVRLIAQVSPRILRSIHTIPKLPWLTWDMNSGFGGGGGGQESKTQHVCPLYPGYNPTLNNFSPFPLVIKVQIFINFFPHFSSFFLNSGGGLLSGKFNPPLNTPLIVLRLVLLKRGNQDS